MVESSSQKTNAQVYTSSHEHQKTKRNRSKPPKTEFTQDEVRQIIEGVHTRKAPGQEGITSEILLLIFKSIPKTVTSIYNECLKKGASQETGG